MLAQFYKVQDSQWCFSKSSQSSSELCVCSARVQVRTPTIWISVSQTLVTTDVLECEVVVSRIVKTIINLALQQRKIQVKYNYQNHYRGSWVSYNYQNDSCMSETFAETFK
jgi:hypothetical protein